MPKQATKIKLSSFSKPVSNAASPANRSTTSPATTGSSTTGSSTQAAAALAEPRLPRAQLLPGGVVLWCLVGLAIGLAIWLGGRSYLKNMLAEQLVSASSEEVALQSIDALLRLDADATIEVSRGLAHPEFMVANAAYRALGGQLDAWTKLEPDDRLQRMQKVVSELERIPEDIDQDHRILVSGLASRIYADALSNRETGAGDVLDACRRVLARTDPQHVPSARTARADITSPSRRSSLEPAPLPSPIEDASPVPPPLTPLDPAIENRPNTSSPEPARLSQVEVDAPRRPMTRTSLSESTNLNEPSRQMHLTSGPKQLPQANNSALTKTAAMPTLQSSEGADPLSPSASSRSRLIPRDVEPLPGESNVSTGSTTTGQPQPVPVLGGIEQLPIDQLVRLLASVQPRVSQAASLTLRQRGMSEENLELAIEMATGSVETRQRLLSELVQRDDLDARPWLLWMAADGQELVRQHAVGLLMPLADNDVRRQLRLLLNRERDEKVAQTIRQVLAK